MDLSRILNFSDSESHVTTMNKRSAVEASLWTPINKRQRGEEDVASKTPNSISNFNADLSDIPVFDDEDDVATTRTTASSVNGADSPLTAHSRASTPRVKFPSDLKTLACTWPGCDKTFNRPARLRDHLNSHTNSRPFKCPHPGCDKDYIEDKHLKQHIIATHTQERKHVCPREGCGKSFVTGTRLKRHQAVHEGEERFRCEDCGQSFRKKETLNKHMRKEHQGLPEHSCPEPGCEEAFNSKPALKRHQDQDHGELKFWCGECGLKTQPDGTEARVGFTTHVLLEAHMRQEHQNCMFCEYKSASRWELEQHVEIYHSGKTVEDRKVVVCPHEGCTKKFTRKSNLSAHIRTAHEGFRFVCGEVDLSSLGLEGWSNDQGCGDKFCSKVRLEDHVRFGHLGHERPKLTRPDSQSVDPIDDLSGAVTISKQNIFCPHCDESFMRYSDLDRHFQLLHDPTNPSNSDPALFFSNTQAHSDSYAAANAWCGDAEEVEEEIFAAQMNHGPARDDWREDEANIMLLARGAHDGSHPIDPALRHI